MKWSLVYEKAIRDDGSLFFPERLNREFLDQIRQSMGSYMFANQYQNEVIPDSARIFKKEWLRYWAELPPLRYTFAFIDPAISLEDTADYTAIVVVDIDSENRWYVKHASRYRVNPTQIVHMLFRINDLYKPMIIGIEDVAYQKALLYNADEEMKRRGVILPLKGVRPDNNKTKQTRILNLVPRFEWGRLLITQGMHDFEMEYAQFPRGKNDDLLDALAYIEQIAVTPTTRKGRDDEPAPNSPEYESWYIRRKYKESSGSSDPGIGAFG